MTLDLLNHAPAVYFFIGMAVGLIFSAAIANAAYKIAVGQAIADSAARIAEKSLQEAEIRVNERRIAETKERLRKLFAELDSAGEQAVAQ